MNVIKTTSNLEFELVYADGIRKRIREGVMFEADETGDIIFHNGTNNLAVWVAAAETALLLLNVASEKCLNALAASMAMSDESRYTMEVFARAADDLLGISKGEKQAVFRLGQMDMKESAAAMLEDLAKATLGTDRSTLLAASEMVKQLGVCE